MFGTCETVLLLIGTDPRTEKADPGRVLAPETAATMVSASSVALVAPTMVPDMVDTALLPVGCTLPTEAAGARMNADLQVEQAARDPTSAALRLLVVDATLMDPTVAVAAEVEVDTMEVACAKSVDMQIQRGAETFLFLVSVATLLDWHELQNFIFRWSGLDEIHTRGLNIGT